MEKEDFLNLLEKHSKMKLQIELIPEGCWFSNVRSNLSPKQWGIIRNAVYKKANNHCEICGGQGGRHPVECHEVWEYDSDTNIQSLRKLQALCPRCHEVKHFGLAELKNNSGRALLRFSIINNISIPRALKVIEAVKEEWRLRSKMPWSLDISLLKDYGIDPNSLLK